MKKIGYARVSTAGQDLGAQLQALEREGCDIVYSEKVSGKNAERAEFRKALSALEKNSMLVVTKLDRFARSAMDATRIVDEIFKKEASVKVLDFGIIENDPKKMLYFNVLSAFAEFERAMISERMAEGKAVARQRPEYKEGRPPKYTRHQMDHAMGLLKDNSFTQVERMTGISKRTLIRQSNKRKGTVLESI